MTRIEILINRAIFTEHMAWNAIQTSFRYIYLFIYQRSEEIAPAELKKSGAQGAHSRNTKDFPQEHIRQKSI